MLLKQERVTTKAYSYAYNKYDCDYVNTSVVSSTSTTGIHSYRYIHSPLFNVIQKNSENDAGQSPKHAWYVGH